jgi:hypothetical protein
MMYQIFLRQSESKDYRTCASSRPTARDEMSRTRRIGSVALIALEIAIYLPLWTVGEIGTLNGAKYAGWIWLAAMLMIPVLTTTVTKTVDNW